jgi:hypothetical protein
VRCHKVKTFSHVYWRVQGSSFFSSLSGQQNEASDWSGLYQVLWGWVENEKAVLPNEK